ncbi:DUF3311 domain-containing protein [Actinokineospora sp.]|uniref:DUF3311 domain-containing protein n=1 Tax=Actinokineospora sp. TaxID=1872133 RepID=UPI00403819D4
MAPPGKAGSGLRWSPWNLLLLVPMIWLITPLFNRTGPELFGMPFFYWFQFLGILVGVTCTSIVFVKTRDVPAEPGDDEGVAR